MSQLKKRKLYYLASPYSHENKFVEILRYEAVIYAAKKLIEDGYTVIEPIAMCHEKGTRYDLPGGYKFWQRRDRWFIEKCDGLVVLQLPGWDLSVGVLDEIKYAKKIGLEVHYLDPDKVLEPEIYETFGVFGGSKDAVHKART